MKYWFRNTTIYSLNVDSFQDSNDDGIGDFNGLVSRLEYIAALGAQTLWLLPIFKTPNKDNGYDVADYFAVDDRLGDFGGFTDVIARAEEHGIRVILDLPINHVSDQHPWFQHARDDPKSVYHDYFIWSKEKPQDDDPKLIFGDEQSGNWKYDKKAQAYYYHTFYDHQPDLNFTNPRVRKEVRRIMHFWLRLGISGFRIDALSHIIRNKGNNFIEDPTKIIREFRQYTEEVSNEAILLGETDVEPDQYKDYFGRDNKFQMLLNFYLSNYIFSALAKKDKAPIEYALNMLPKANSFQQYANFLRNHDELDLERLNDSERKEVFDLFAPKENMRIFGRGIRRRLPAMFNNNRKLLELTYSLLFSLPGSPIIRYGDEIGMGDDLDLPGRQSVRTAMQWSNEKNAGFSPVNKNKLKIPVIESGPFGKDKVNVDQQFKDEQSFLSWMIKLIRMRKKCIEFGRGVWQILDTGNPHVLGHYAKLENEMAVAFHNLSDKPEEVSFSLGDDNVSRLVYSFGDKDHKLFEEQEDIYNIKIKGYGYMWFEGSISKK